jgi:hypothetical protein
MKSWKVTLDVGDDIYRPWRDYLSARGIKLAGKGARVRSVNSGIFIEAIKNILANGEITLDKSKEK